MRVSPPGGQLAGAHRALPREDHGVRPLKDAISRDVLAAFDTAGIEVASATYEIVGVPPLRVIQEAPQVDVTPPGASA